MLCECTKEDLLNELAKHSWKGLTKSTIYKPKQELLRSLEKELKKKTTTIEEVKRKWEKEGN